MTIEQESILPTLNYASSLDDRDRKGRTDRAHLLKMTGLACILVLLLDVWKPVLWPQWKPVATYGRERVLSYYTVIAIVNFLSCWILIRVLKKWYQLYYFTAFVFLLSGISAHFIERGLIPIVWHGAVGFSVAVTIAFRRAFIQFHDTWWQVESQYTQKDALDVRKETMKEMQWAMTTFTQVWIALTAIFGVSMTILFKDGNINLDDLKATAIQMSLGFGSCLTVAYWWGFSYALEVMARARMRWTEPPSPLKLAKNAALGKLAFPVRDGLSPDDCGSQECSASTNTSGA